MGGGLIMAFKFAKRMERMQSSEIRELLKLTQKPEIISFAGGLPAPELFPVEELAKMSKDEVARELLDRVLARRQH